MLPIYSTVCVVILPYWQHVSRPSMNLVPRSDGRSGTTPPFICIKYSESDAPFMQHPILIFVVALFESCYKDKSGPYSIVISLLKRFVFGDEICKSRHLVPSQHLNLVNISSKTFWRDSDEMLTRLWSHLTPNLTRLSNLVTPDFLSGFLKHRFQGGNTYLYTISTLSNRGIKIWYLVNSYLYAPIEMKFFWIAIFMPPHKDMVSFE